MSRATVAFTCRLPIEVVEALKRQAAMSGWSQPKLIESFALELEDRWLRRFNAEERARYEGKFMSVAEAMEIRRRSMKGAGEHAPREPEAMADRLPVAAHATEDAA
jgi:hypothetical protein